MSIALLVLVSGQAICASGAMLAIFHNRDRLAIRLMFGLIMFSILFFGACMAQ